MATSVLYSIVESAGHPDFSGLYRRLGLRELRFGTMRKAIGALKTHKPDVVVAEFFYGYGNNYAGANVGNLDVFLSSLQKYAPEARVIVLVDKTERQHLSKVEALFPIAAVLEQPVEGAQLERLLKQ